MGLNISVDEFILEHVDRIYGVNVHSYTFNSHGEAFIEAHCVDISSLEALAQRFSVPRDRFQVFRDGTYHPINGTPLTSGSPVRFDFEKPEGYTLRADVEHK